jgi:hypothetical protein
VKPLHLISFRFRPPIPLQRPEGVQECVRQEKGELCSSIKLRETDS